MRKSLNLKFIKMKQLKITTLILAIIATFASCKKENLTEPTDYISTNMKMNYYGKVFEYTVRRSPSTNKSDVVGRDANQVKEILKSNQNSIAIFETPTEITYFKNIGDYAYHRKLDKSFIKNNRISTTGETDDVQSTDFSIKLYQHSNFQNLMQQHDFNSRAQGSDNFTLYYDCNQIESNFFTGNQTTQNDCAGQTVQLNGFKVPYVGNNQNDSYTSIEILKNSSTTGIYCDVVFFQNSNFGGKAFVLQYRGNNVEVANLKNYRFNAYQQNWNDSVSSYYCYNW